MDVPALHLDDYFLFARLTRARKQYSDILRRWKFDDKRDRTVRRQDSRSHPRLLDHQDCRDDAGRNRRRHRYHDAELGLPRRHRAVSVATGRLRHLADRGDEISFAALLGNDHRLDDRRHDDGRLCRSVARHRLRGRLTRLVCLRDRDARRLVLVARLDFSRDRQHTEGGSLLLDRHHLLADTRHRARRLDRRRHRPRL